MTPSPSRNDPADAAYLDLRKLARADGRPTDELIQLYALEGFLGRLAASPHNESLVLKGGVLLAAFDIRRPTRDIDFAAVTIDGDAEHIRQVVNDVLAVKQDDGLTFDIPRTAVEPIRDDELYPCVRAMVRATLATAKIRFHIDVNIGDPLWPKPQKVAVPRLLGGDPISVVGYSVELVLAEKIGTAVQRGTANTRWRDFVDISRLAAKPSDVAALRRSIAVVAGHRDADLATLRDVLAGYDTIAQSRWAAWRANQGLDDTPEAFSDLLAVVVAFADRHIDAAKPATAL